MKVKTLIKALEKAGLTVEQDKYRNGQYICKAAIYICTFYKNGADSDEAVCVNVRRHNDEHDSQSDYSAGFFAKTIKQVIQVLINE